MAYTYERKDSPWVWICFLDASGKRRRQSTEIRRGTPDTSRKSKKLEAEYILRENELPRVRTKEDAWENWVDDYFASRYKKKPHTLTRAREAWFALSTYLKEKLIRAPRGLNYLMIAAYMDWRQSHKSGLRVVSHNTARLELSYLKIVMSEAVRREYAPTNPCRELEIGRQPPKKKREITPDEEKKIEAALVNAHQWMRESWSVYMRLGCRLSEVEIPLDQIEEDATPPLITFRIKGGRMHTMGLHPELIPLVKLARAEKRPVLVKISTAASKVWTDLFESLGIEGLSLHCTRVTVISRLIRAGERSVDVREFIGHKSDSMQAIYRRIQPADVSSLTRHLGEQRNTPSNETPGVRATKPRRGRAS